jgi:hypothetical protein
MTLDCYADLFDDDLDEVADRLDALRAASRERVADHLRTGPAERGVADTHPAGEAGGQSPIGLVETRGIEPLTPALQRRCSAN